MARVIAIYICQEKGEPMVQVGTARALAGKGLDGDRYASGRGAWSHNERVMKHVSLIAAEAIAAANADHALSFLPQETRRNIITVGVDLNALVGREFMIGDVWMRGIEPCTPCERPSKLSSKPGFKERLAGRGGLRAEILDDGVISTGDEIIAQL